MAFVASLASSLEQSANDLTCPERASSAWNDLLLACLVSRRVERLGVVRGLGGIIEEAYLALESMRAQCMESGVWRYRQPNQALLSAIREMAKLHAFQIGHLSAAEFEKVYLAARSDLASQPRIVTDG